MGEKDGFAFGDAYKHLQTIKENTKHKKGVVKVIENGRHTFRGCEKLLAKAILEFVLDKTMD